jgi:pre-mRNA-splicing factor 18
MDLLKAEMERKKQAVGMAKPSTQKFVRAGDLRRLREEAAAAEEEERRRRRKRQRKDHTESQTTDETNAPTHNSTKATTTGSSPASTAAKTATIDSSKQDNGIDTTKTKKDENNQASKDEEESRRKDEQKLKPQEVTQLLRELGLPIRLFGERTIRLSKSKYDDSKRLARLAEAKEQQKVAKAGMSEMDDFRLRGEHNQFLDKDTAPEEEHGLDHTKKVERSKDKKQNDDEDEGEENDEDDPPKRIYKFLKGLLKSWEEDLALRPDSVKRTLAGKNETKTLKQCKDYIRPLFKLCKNRRLEPSLEAHLFKIVEFCKEGEFVKAHDSYMDVAIGRAAWPIGVTMVGIHARSGRAKIESANVAHVMNSELQRKYLTSVKRLMSYYQKKRTDVAPSKKVLNL